MFKIGTVYKINDHSHMVHNVEEKLVRMLVTNEVTGLGWYSANTEDYWVKFLGLMPTILKKTVSTYGGPRVTIFEK